MLQLMSLLFFVFLLSLTSWTCIRPRIEEEGESTKWLCERCKFEVERDAKKDDDSIYGETWWDYHARFENLHRQIRLDDALTAAKRHTLRKARIHSAGDEVRRITICCCCCCCSYCYRVFRFLLLSMLCHGAVRWLLF